MDHTTLKLSDLLREALRCSGKPLVEIERITGVPRDSLGRFLSGEQSLRLDSAEKLAACFSITCVAPAWIGAGGRAALAKPENFLHLLAQSLNSARPDLECPQTNGHFFTVCEIEPSVKMEVLRRARGRETVIVIGLAFNSGSGSLNRQQAKRYERFLHLEKPPFAIERFPSPKINCYLTAVFPVPGVAERKDQFLASLLNAAIWFVDRDYGRVSESEVYRTSMKEPI